MKCRNTNISIIYKSHVLVVSVVAAPAPATVPTLVVVVVMRVRRRGVWGSNPLKLF